MWKSRKEKLGDEFLQVFLPENNLPVFSYRT